MVILAENEHKRMNCHTMEITSCHHWPALSCLDQKMVPKKFTFIIGGEVHPQSG